MNDVVSVQGCQPKALVAEGYLSGLNVDDFISICLDVKTELEEKKVSTMVDSASKVAI